MKKIFLFGLLCLLLTPLAFAEDLFPPIQCGWWSGSPKLFVTASVDGDIKESGDVFLYTLAIKNTAKGSIDMAGQVQISLQEYNPVTEEYKVFGSDRTAGWSKQKVSGEIYYSVIMPGETKYLVYEITRDDIDAELAVGVRACNAKEVKSNIVAIPIFWITIGGIFVVLCGMTYFSVKNSRGKKNGKK